MLSTVQATRSSDLKRQQSQRNPPHCALPVVLQMTCRRWYLCLPLISWNQSRTTMTARLEKMVSAASGKALHRLPDWQQQVLFHTLDAGTSVAAVLEAAVHLDLLLMPGLGFDTTGRRLGRGGG